MLDQNPGRDLHKYIIFPTSNFRAMFEKILKENVLVARKEEMMKRKNGKRSRVEVSNVPQGKKVVVTDEMKFNNVNVQHWRVSQTVQWLKQIDLSHLSSLFSSMNGMMLVSCTPKSLRDMGVNRDLHIRKIILKRRKLLKGLRENVESNTDFTELRMAMWRVSQTLQWLKHIELETLVPVFREHSIDGELLNELTDSILETSMNIKNFMHRRKIVLKRRRWKDEERLRVVDLS